MRRVNHLFEQIVAHDNLRMAVYKALRGKRSKRDAREFVADLDGNLELMRSALLREDIALGEYHQFTIFDPKERFTLYPESRFQVLAEGDDVTINTVTLHHGEEGRVPANYLVVRNGNGNGHKP